MLILTAFVIFLYTVSLTVRLTQWFAVSKRSKSQSLTTDSATVVVLIPVLREQACIEATITHFAQAHLPPANYRIVIVSCEAEELQAKAEGVSITTATIVDRVALSINAEVGFRLVRRIHYPYHHGWMAHQVNYGVRYLFEAFEREIDPERTVIGIFNADSRPDLQLLSEAAANDKAVLQACSIYSLNSTPGNLLDWLLVVPAALWQTRWSIGVEYWRLVLSSWISVRPKRSTRLEVIRPYTYTVGHGLFVRYKEMIELNYLPEFTPNEDAAYGYLLPCFNIVPSPAISLDRADVPSDAKTLIQQQAGWIVGPLNAFNYRRYAIDAGLEPPNLATWFKACKAVWDAIIWIVGPFVFLCAVAFVVHSKGALLLVFAYLLYLYIPSLPLFFVAPALFPFHRRPMIAFWLGLVFLPIFYVAHGFAGCLGTFRALLYRGKAELFPKYKTER